MSDAERIWSDAYHGLLQAVTALGFPESLGIAFAKKFSVKIFYKLSLDPKFIILRELKNSRKILFKYSADESRPSSLLAPLQMRFKGGGEAAVQRSIAYGEP